MLQIEQAHPSCSVILMGNPGVGKSAILNALGGSFYSGFSLITGNPGSSKQVVTLGDKTVELIDLPGIADAGGGGDAMSRNLQLLHDTLSSCKKALLFFVIKPNNGRIAPEDFAILKTLLKNLSKSPKIGLFVTQVREDHIPLLDKDEYRKTVLKMLQDSGVGTANLEAKRWSILRQHQTEGFTEAEKKTIREYVDSFVSAEVEVDNFVVRIFWQIIEYFKRLFGG